MNVYGDHNFLIYCAENPVWRKAIVEACARRDYELVFSPFHFYEFGNIRLEKHREQLLSFAEEVQPAWILERADIQVREFVNSWVGFWTGRSSLTVEAIGSLSASTAALFRNSSAELAKATLRDFVAEFTPERIAAVLIPTLEEQQRIADANRKDFRAGVLTPAMFDKIGYRYVVQQILLSRSMMLPTGQETLRKALLSETLLLQGMIVSFVKGGKLVDLRNFLVESAFTEDLYNGNATLNKRRFLDRQHAISALAHCDIFVTNDDDLINRCERVRKELPNPVAEVERPDVFMKRLIPTLTPQ